MHIPAFCYLQRRYYSVAKMLQLDLNFDLLLGLQMCATVPSHSHGYGDACCLAPQLQWRLFGDSCQHSSETPSATEDGCHTAKGLFCGTHSRADTIHTTVPWGSKVKAGEKGCFLGCLQNGPCMRARLCVGLGKKVPRAGRQYRQLGVGRRWRQTRKPCCRLWPFGDLGA